MITRRDALYGIGMGIGSVALSAMLEDDARADPLFPKPGHLPASAKACIFLMMEGGPSHIDTFDPKPKLADLHLKDFQRNDAMQSAMSGGKRYYVQSPFSFHIVGTCGADMVMNWNHLSGGVDSLCFSRSSPVAS